MSEPLNIVLQGRYELIGQLGRGGMGVVYMARDKHLHNRPCVVKKLHYDFYQEDQTKAIGFFKREAGVLSGLQHPNIVHILDYFEENNDYFLVMEYVEGQDLQTILTEHGKPFIEEQVLNWSLQILEVLEYLHDHKPPVIYRDLKPSNIMLDMNGYIKLVDFGIARPAEEGTDNTNVVSAGFSPPEQYWGAADPRSDIYALGSTMYFLLTGKEPTALEPSSTARDNPAVSNYMDEIIRIATAQDVGTRFQKASDMRQALQEASAPTEKRKYTSEIIITAIILVFAFFGWLTYQKLDQLLEVKTKQLSEGIDGQETKQLKEKLKEYRRAVDANNAALEEWRTSASDKNKKLSEKSYGMEARQVDSEERLTDPEAIVQSGKSSSE